VQKKDKMEDGKTAYVMKTCSGSRRDFMSELYRKLGEGDKPAFYWHECRHRLCDEMKRESFDLEAAVRKLHSRYMATVSVEVRQEIVSILWLLSQAILGERDYGENHTIHSLLELQGQHWCHKQITIMPYIVRFLEMWYASEAELWAAVSADPSKMLQLRSIKDYVVVVSDYHAHDNNFSQNSERVVLQLFASLYPDRVFSLWLVWSDNANHFKGADEFLGVGAFKFQAWNKDLGVALAAATSEDGLSLGLSKVNNYTAENHGSSEVDVVTFVIKREHREAETKGDGKWGGAPTNGLEAAPFLRRRFEQPKRTPSGKQRSSIHSWHFPLLEEQHLELTPRGQTLSDSLTRRCFAFRSGASPSLIMVSVLPCGCIACLTQRWSECAYMEMHCYVNGKLLGEAVRWIEVEVHGETTRDVRLTREMVSNTFVKLAATATVGTAVGVWANKNDEGGHSFAMVCVTKRLYKNEKPVVQRGVTFKKGAMVFQGQYFDRREGSKTEFVKWSDPTTHQSPTLLFNAENVRFVKLRWAPTQTGGRKGKAIYVLTDAEVQLCEERSRTGS